MSLSDSLQVGVSKFTTRRYVTAKFTGLHSPMSQALWRPLTAADVDAVSTIARAVHPGFFERDSVFAERIALAPQGCWLLEGAEGPALGYVLSHPWTLGSVPALDSHLGALPQTPDCFYLHDLALAETARGTGAAKDIVTTLIEIAAPHGAMALVAVNRSAPFWSRFGFAPDARPHLATKLTSYDADAVYMVRDRDPLP